MTVAPAGADVRAARRRLVLLTTLQQLASGVVLATWLLTAGARGLDAAQVATLVAVVGVGTAVLELPTGALADVLGRPGVLCAAALAAAGAYALFAVAASTPALWAAAALLAVARALASGPLEAWFVDQVGTDPGLVRDGVSRAATATGLGLAAGGLLGGLLAGVGAALGLPEQGGPGLLALSVPFVLATALALVEAALVLVLLRGDGAGAAARTAADLRRDLVDVLPRRVASGAALAVRDGVLRWFAVRWLLVPVGFLALELLSPLRLAELLAGPSDAALVLGPLTAGCFAGVGLAAATAPWLGRRLGVLPAAAASTVAAGAAFALAGSGGVAVLVAGVLAGFLASGPGNPLLAPLVHARVDGPRRATLLSVRSLAGNLAVAAGALVLGGTGEAAGTPWAFALAGVLTALSALPLLGVARAKG